MKKVIVCPLSRAVLLCTLFPIACLASMPSPPAAGALSAIAPPSAVQPTPDKAPAPPGKAQPPQESIAQIRDAVDKLLADAQQARQEGDIAKAISLSLAAATKLQQAGFERDQVTILRNMTIDADPAFAKAGSSAMAEYYYQRFLSTRPEDEQWLLESLAWANYSGDPSLLQKLTALAPVQAYTGIEERARQRGIELKADDQQYLAADMIRQNQVDALRKILKNRTYPINRTHSLEGTSLLHTAVWYKKTGIARMLVEEYHADVNVTDKQNDTPLDYAEYQKAADLVTYLKSKGARANKQYGQAAPAKPAAPSTSPVSPPAKACGQ